MDKATPSHFTAFNGSQRLASGPLSKVAIAVKHAVEAGAAGPILIYDDGSGQAIDFDTRGSDAEVVARLPHEADEPRGRGRPKLGVVSREVTLLPRHWEWLGVQPGGASVALRKLVDEARRTRSAADRSRAAKEAAYRFMSAMAGDLPGFEEAARALFADDRNRLEALVETWPVDIRDHALELVRAAGRVS